MTNDEFAKTRDQAVERAEEHRWSDPEQDIPPGPLNSDAVAKYIQKTGLFFPFTPGPDRKDKNRVKQASIAVPLYGSVHSWNSKGERLDQVIGEKKGVEIIIPRNSITYFFLQAEFRLPKYILMRFDLAVVHVHNGLLLGTGPIVDPTFQGRLFIPVHNLTNSDYSVFSGDEFIHCEFSKLVPFAFPNRDWEIDKPGHDDSFDVEHYLKKIAQRRISSSLAQIAEQISNFEGQIHNFGEKIRKYSLGGIIGVALAIAALLLGAFDLSFSISSELRDLRERVALMEEARVSSSTRIHEDQGSNDIAETPESVTPSSEPSDTDESLKVPVQPADAEG